MKIFFKKRCKVVKLYFYTILVDEIVDFLTSPLERERKHCKKNVWENAQTGSTTLAQETL